MITRRGKYRCDDNRYVNSVFIWIIVRVCWCPSGWIIFAICRHNFWSRRHYHYITIVSTLTWLLLAVWELAAANSQHVTKVMNSSVLAYCINSFHKGTYLTIYKHNLYVTSWLHIVVPPVAAVQRFDPVGGQCWPRHCLVYFSIPGSTRILWPDRNRAHARL
jgi:hypothetical protein